jgi:hypothetical protein
MTLPPKSPISACHEKSSVKTITEREAPDVCQLNVSKYLAIFKLQILGMAPEALEANVYTVYSDIWSYGKPDFTQFYNLNF